MIHLGDEYLGYIGVTAIHSECDILVRCRSTRKIKFQLTYYTLRTQLSSLHTATSVNLHAAWHLRLLSIGPSILPDSPPSMPPSIASLISHPRRPPTLFPRRIIYNVQRIILQLTSHDENARPRIQPHVCLASPPWSHVPAVQPRCVRCVASSHGDAQYRISGGMRWFHNLLSTLWVLTRPLKRQCSHTFHLCIRSGCFRSNTVGVPLQTA